MTLTATSATSIPAAGSHAIDEVLDTEVLDTEALDLEALELDALDLSRDTGLRERFEVLAVDLYRDIHKGIRAELFALTNGAGSVDPADPVGHLALAAHVKAVHRVLESHAHHEDAWIDQPLAATAPDLAARINTDHEVLEARFAAVAELAVDMVDGPSLERRRLLQLLHLQLSGFTSAYLQHLLVEEHVVMPTLAAALTPEEVIAIHVGIVSSIPPEEMTTSLAFMLPAMNADDRADLLGGMRHSAPAEAFEGVIGLARSVLEAGEYAATAARLGLG
jgi:hypothetical protein